MKILILTITTTALITLVACKTKKENTTSTAAATPAPTNPAPPSPPPLLIRPVNGIYAPGADELKAIQGKMADATMDQLTIGHYIYTEGACINCHKAKNIYNIPEGSWSGILADMALKARMNESQKDAVNKYVLAIKAMQGH